MYKSEEYQPAYRADIDGLRTVAVVSVVAFHLFGSLLGRGFLGVDVFFVSSGFLITTILVRECERGDYSILGFYGRRVRRIMPVLSLVIAVTNLAVTLTFLTTELMGYGKSALATFAFISNIYF